MILKLENNHFDPAGHTHAYTYSFEKIMVYLEFYGGDSLTECIPLIRDLINTAAGNELTTKQLQAVDIDLADCLKKLTA